MGAQAAPVAPAVPGVAARRPTVAHAGQEAAQAEAASFARPPRWAGPTTAMSATVAGAPGPSTAQPAHAPRRATRRPAARLAASPTTPAPRAPRPAPHQTRGTAPPNRR